MKVAHPWSPMLSSARVEVAAGRRASDADDEHAENGKPKPKPSLSDVIAVCGVPGVPSLLGTKFLAGLSGELFQTTLPLALKDNYHLSLAQSGQVMSLLGMLSMAGVLPVA